MSLRRRLIASNYWWESNFIFKNVAETSPYCI